MTNDEHDSAAPHLPVLLTETIEALALQPGDNVLDGTVGAGGHAAAALERTAPGGRLLGLDLDEVALETASKNLHRFGSRVMLVRGSYRDAASIAAAGEFEPVQAALLDLGFSSMELDDPARGFSLRQDGPLDMRFDRRQELTAATVVNGWGKDDLERVIRVYGEERYSRRIAEAIVRARREAKLVGTRQLVDAIAGAVPAVYRHGRLHFATRTFQALRIATNDELETVKAALPALLGMLAPGGRLAVISFHSLEDRVVKQTFQQMVRAGEAELPFKKPIVATEAETAVNQRARSAKLRVAIKL
jgi:16S rRNA (cytosine1402-N4)-methyltransferase